MARVSIIVPVYNVQDYIEECLDSLVNQTFKDIEIILVDDGSTDNSAKVCDEYAKKDKRIKVIHKENGGQSSARNRGLDISSGEYVLFVDSDDYIAYNSVEILLENAEKYNADIVQGDLLNDADKLGNSEFRKLDCDYKAVNTLEFLSCKIQTETYDIVPVLYFVKKEYLVKNNIKFIEGYFYEDQLWTMQLLSNGATIVKIRFPFYYYRMNRPGSTTNHMYLKKGTDAAFICNSMAEYIDNHSDKEMKKHLKAILLMSVFQFFSVWLKLSRHDRSIAWNELNKTTVDLALECDYAYKHLRQLVIKYYTHKNTEALKYDIKRFLRKIIKGR